MKIEFKKAIIFFLEMIDGEPIKQVRRYNDPDKAIAFVQDLYENPNRKIVGEVEIKFHYNVKKEDK